MAEQLSFGVGPLVRGAVLLARRIKLFRSHYRIALKAAAGVMGTPMTDDSAEQRIADMLMECAERLGNFPRAQIDPRAWQHLLVYAPAAGVLAAPAPLPLMQAAFRTTVSYGPDGLYEMRFKFPSMAAIQAADAEWRAHVAGVTTCACEGKPSGENDPCAVCGTKEQSA